MKKLTIISAFMLATCTLAMSQTSVFNKTLRFDSLSRNFAFGIRYNPSHNQYYSSGWQISSITDQWSAFFSIFDSTGNLTHEQHSFPAADSIYYGPYQFGNLLASPESIYYTLNGYTLYNSDFTERLDDKILLQAFDSLGTEILYVTYSSDSSLEGNDLCYLNDSNVLIGGGISDTSYLTKDALILKVDMIGNVIWQKVWGDPNTMERITHIVSTKQNTAYYALNTALGLTIPWRGYIGHIDSNGNVIKQVNLHPSPYRYQLPSVYTSTFDGGALVSYLDYDPYDSGSNDTSFVFKTDTGLNVEWMYPFLAFEWDMGRKEIMGAIQNKDSSFLLYGSSNTQCWGWAAKLSKNGHLVWSGEYRNDTGFVFPGPCFHYLVDAVQTDEGGWALCGTALDSKSIQSMWLLKIDSNGCIAPSCPKYYTGMVTHYEHSLPVLYPNPASESISLKSEVAFQYTIWNAVGHVVNNGTSAPNQPISIAHLPAGLYFFQIQPLDISSDSSAPSQVIKFIKY